MAIGVLFSIDISSKAMLEDRLETGKSQFIYKRIIF